MDSTVDNNTCGKCNLNLRKTQTKITCAYCAVRYHIKCHNLNNTDYNHLKFLNLDSSWMCNSCTHQIFPLCAINFPIDSTTNLNTSPITPNKLDYCSSCDKLMGKISKKCDFCCKFSHVHCHAQNMGCISCLKNIFPGFMYSVNELFEHQYDNKNRTKFNPYSTNSFINDIGSSELFDSIEEQIAWQSVSDNLANCKYEKLSDIKTSRDNELKILSLNVRSLKKALPRLQDIDTHLNKFDILCFNETCCKIDTLPFGKQQLRIDGFNLPIIQEPVRASGRGGGLAIYVSKKICSDSSKITIHRDLSCSENINDGEHLYIEIDMGHKMKNIIIGNFYRSPSAHPNNFLNKHKNNLENLAKHKNKIIVLAGDTNIDLLRYESYEPALTLLNIHSELGFAPLISRPTRVTHNSATLIDHIYSNNCHNVTRSGVITLDISDHLATYTTILTSTTDPHLGKQNENFNFSTTRGNFDKQNLERFRISLKYTDWESVYQTSTADDKFDIFNKKYTELYNKAFLNDDDVVAKNTRRKPRKNSKPWMQEWLSNACNRKNRMYYKYIKHPTIENKTKYKKLKSFVEKHTNKAKHDYYTKYFKMHQNDSRKQWTMINQILNRKKKFSERITKLVVDGKVLTNTADITEAFNNYFTNIAKDLKKHNNCHQTQTTTNTAHRSYNTLKLDPCSATEISDIIKSFQNKATSDTSIQALKHAEIELIPILTHIIGSSLTQGIFPSSLKCAKVIPLHKGDSKIEISNYRPISLLPTFSKIYERAMHTRIYDFLNRNNLIFASQYGFRKGHSCEHALISAENTILHTLDKKEIAILLLIDFSKAFDMVDHSILLNKLDHYGIRDTALCWMRSYLSQREQCVSIGGTVSSMRKLEFGVPQGSILGPLLFLIYVNDLHLISNFAKFIMYADDANIIISGKNVSDLIEKVNQLINNLQNWVNNNGLKMNLKKTKYMLFTNKSNNGLDDLDIIIDNNKISRVTHQKFLGVIIDEKLNFNMHRNLLAAKIARNSGILYNLRGTVPQSVILTLYYSFIQSHLCYCPSIWGLGSQASLNSIFKSQKKSIRVVENNFTNYFYNPDTGEFPTHTKPIFTKHKLLTVHNIVLQHVLTLMYKIYNNLAPNEIQSYFIKNSPDKVEQVRKTRKITNFFSTPKTRLKLQDKSILIQGPRLFNIICTEYNKKILECTKEIHLQKKFTRPFRNCCKGHILDLQSAGNSTEWSMENFPLTYNKIEY